MQTKRRPLFIYQGPHYVHAEWAYSVNSKFVHFRLVRRFRKFKPAKIILRASLLTSLTKPMFVMSEGGAPLTEAALVKIVKNTPMIYLATDITPWKMINGDSYLTELTELSDLVVANSKMMIDDLLKCCSLKNYVIIYPFVRNHFFNFYEYARDIEKDERKGIFVGSLTRFKGAHLLTEVAERIRRKVARFKLIAIGRPHDVKLKETKALKPVGYISTSDPWALHAISSAKVYVHPAIYESFGVSIAESIILGTLPVVTNHTGIKEFLPKDLIADSIADLVEKVIYVLHLNQDEYDDLIMKIRNCIIPKVRKDFSVNSFKSCVSHLWNLKKVVNLK